MKYKVESFARNKDGDELVAATDASTREEARKLKRTLKDAYPALITVIRNTQAGATVR